MTARTRLPLRFPGSVSRPRRLAPILHGLLVAAWFWVAGSAGATVADLPQLERELMNPCENCGGKPLAGSYCGGASEAKAELREMVAAGMSHEEIKSAFVAKYGEWILAVPERSGFNLFAWILPVVGIVVGGGGLALFLRRTNQARSRAGSTPDRAPFAGGPVAAEPTEDPVVPIAARSAEGDAVATTAPDELAALRRRLAREVHEA